MIEQAKANAVDASPDAKANVDETAAFLEFFLSPNPLSLSPTAPEGNPEENKTQEARERALQSLYGRLEGNPEENKTQEARERALQSLYGRIESMFPSSQDAKE